MKKYGKYLIAAVAGLVFFAACDNYEADDHKFGNAVYLDVAETNEVQLTTFGNNKPTYRLRLAGGADLSCGTGCGGDAHGRPVARRDVQRPLRYGVDDARCQIL